MKPGAFRKMRVAATLAGACFAPGAALAHSDVSVHLSFGQPVVVYRDRDRYHHSGYHEGYARPVVIYRYVDGTRHWHGHRHDGYWEPGYGHGRNHRHNRDCRH